jgi:hypothetical protein
MVLGSTPAGGGRREQQQPPAVQPPDNTAVVPGCGDRAQTANAGDLPSISLPTGGGASGQANANPVVNRDTRNVDQSAAVQGRP